MTPIARCRWFDANPDDPFREQEDKALRSYPSGTSARIKARRGVVFAMGDCDSNRAMLKNWE